MSSSQPFEEDEGPPTIPLERRAAGPEAPRGIGNYRITGVIADGSMGMVYRAEHVAVGLPVAIKVANHALRDDPDIAARFVAEAVAIARVAHRNVVRFLDFGHDDEGRAYLVTELLEGETLSQYLARERRLAVPVAVEIAGQIAQGLAAAHARGVVHRDLKPENIFLSKAPAEPHGIVVKLLDFGIAKLADVDARRTRHDALLGTPSYMAPEQGVAPSDSDARSDLYSLGCILFEMVCGVVPFPGNLVETLVAHQSSRRPPARSLNPGISPTLGLVIDRLLARDPMERPQSTAEVVRAFAMLAERSRPRTAQPCRASTEPIQDPSWSPLPGVLVAVLAAVGILAALAISGL